MKKLLTKIRNKRLKGNISLLVILILLASSTISLLSISQIQHLMTYGNMTFNYFRAFYLAKAGTELGLTEVYNRGDGFEWQVTDENNDIITKNFLGEGSKYEAFNPSFTMIIKSNFETITKDITNQTCEGNEIELKPGEGLMLSLFKDTTNNLNNVFNPGDGSYDSYKNIENLTLEGQGTFTFGLFGYNDKNRENIYDFKVNNENNLNDFLQNGINGVYKYLTIKNSGNNDAKFCINSNGDPIPYSSFIISVRGNYGDMEVGLESIVKKSTPFRSLDVWDNPPTNQP